MLFNRLSAKNYKISLFLPEVLILDEIQGSGQDDKIAHAPVIFKYFHPSVFSVFFFFGKVLLVLI